MRHNPLLQNTSVQRQLGLTLVELMVTLGLVAIVAGVGIPNFKNLVANQTRLTATNDLVATMYLARNEALKRSKHVTVCKSLDGSSCASQTADWSHGWIVFANTARNNATVLDQDETIIRVFGPLSDQISFDSPDGLDGVITFRPTGEVDVSGTLVYCDGRESLDLRAVVVERSGRARVSTRTFADGNLVCE